MSAAPSTSGVSDDGFEFSDLNLIHDHRDPHNTLLMVQRAVDYGYDAVAINTDIGELTEELAAAASVVTAGDGAGPARKKKKASASRMKSIPPPYTVDIGKLNLHSLETAGKRFRQYSRITATLSEQSRMHAFLNSPVVRSYDLVVVRPSNEDMMAALARKGAGEAGVDMLTFDSTDKVYWLTRFKLIQMAVEKGIGMEMSYGPALSDSSVRRRLLSNGRTLLSSAKRQSTGVVLTSGATCPMDIRPPYDAANLAFLFGAAANTGKRLISGNARAVMLRAESKRSVKGAVVVKNANAVLPRQLSLLMKVAEFRAEVTVAEKLSPTRTESDGKAKPK